METLVLVIGLMLAAVLLVGVTGYGCGAIFAFHGAPDLALTQFLVETLMLIIFVLVLRTLPAEADRTQMGQVVVNLCTNAVEALQGGGRIGIRTRNVELDETQAQAKEIAAADSSVKSILSAARNEATQGSAELFTEPSARVGAAVNYTLSHATDIDLALPYVDDGATDDASVARGYGVAKRRYKLTGLTTFVVFVDLRSKQVAGFRMLKFTGIDPSAR